MSASFKAKVKEFDEILGSAKLNLTQIRQLCTTGIPEGQGRRSLAWRILLNYLPLDRTGWKEYLDKQRKLYGTLLGEMMLNNNDTQKEEEEIPDHPLNPNPKSQWQSFFKDNEVLLQIDKDVRRLCPDISFFSQPTEYPRQDFVHGRDRLHQRVQQTILNAQTVERKGLGVTKLSISKKKSHVSDYAPLEQGDEAHWEVVERILFLYAKLNPGQGYVQGMNEIIGPIYYVFATDSRPEWKEYAEADCFFCFTNLMSDIRDFFIKTLDEAESGVNGIMGRFVGKIRSVDPEVDRILIDQGIKPQFYSFRWLTLMLSQEFPLPDVLRLWDSVLSDEGRVNVLIDICVAMIVLIRDNILENEFPENMKLLQNYPSVDVQVIINKAMSL